MPRKLDPIEAERRELKQSIRECESVLADPNSTAATRARMIELRQEYRDRLRSLPESSPKAGRSRADSASKPWQLQASEQPRTTSTAGQDADELEQEPKLLHDRGPADEFYEDAWHTYVGCLLGRELTETEAALEARYGPDAISNFVADYDAARKVESETGAWNPPAIPSPLAVQKMDAGKDDVSDSSDEEGSVSEPATENASTGTLAVIFQ